MMKPQAPLLPEANFQALSAAKLEAMIDIALSHPQEHAAPQQGNVIAFPRRNWFQNMAYSGGLATMAASVLLAFMLAPDSTTTAVTASLDNSSSSAEVSDMLLYETFGA